MENTGKIRACVLSIVQLLLLLSLTCNVAIYDELFEAPDSIFISSITPNSGTEPDLVFITELRGGYFMPGATVMLSRAGFPDIAAMNVTVVSDTLITCDIDLTGAAIGQWDVLVINPDGLSAVFPDGFTVSWYAPTVTGITPISGVVPDTISITDLAGTNFKPGATVRLTMAGQPDIIATNVNVLSEFQITCDIDLAGVMCGQWNVVVENTDGLSGTLPNGFTVNLSAPMNISATDNTTFIRIEWDPVIDADGYYIEWAKDIGGMPSAYSVIADIPGTLHDHVDAFPQAVSWYRVQAYNNQGGISAYGTEVSATMTGTVLFAEDWEDGVWNDTWVDDRIPGKEDQISINGAYYVPPGSLSLRIRSYAEWTYYDTLHYEFGGIQPGYVRFYIRKQWDQSVHPYINIGDDSTSINGGAIFFRWDSLSNFHMSVAGGGSVLAPCCTFHLVEFRNIDFTAQTFDFYVDGALVTADVPFNAPTAIFTRLYISVGWWAQDARIDKIEIRN